MAEMAETESPVLQERKENREREDPLDQWE